MDQTQARSDKTPYRDPINSLTSQVIKLTCEVEELTKRVKTLEGKVDGSLRRRKFTWCTFGIHSWESARCAKYRHKVCLLCSTHKVEGAGFKYKLPRSNECPLCKADNHYGAAMTRLKTLTANTREGIDE